MYMYVCMYSRSSSIDFVSVIIIIIHVAGVSAELQSVRRATYIFMYIYIYIRMKTYVGTLCIDLGRIRSGTCHCTTNAGRFPVLPHTWARHARGRWAARIAACGWADHRRTNRRCHGSGA